ncbi:MAG: AmmeMemoRadiSam system radical SAM enzyme [Candidatus Eisenbacteria bacterium]|nr:AmmeMemoRadiSam system radical SAM enzyme [Candidatus Eisenbacteria bacterium]
MIEARYWTALEDGEVLCELCPHHCRLKDGQRGICMGRVNERGRLYTKNYGEIVSAAVDPIEKKPLYHFYPGSVILSVGPNGCNFRCPYCQNWEISQAEVRTTTVSPADLVKAASKDDSIGIAYTYAEPLIWYEYVLECSKLAREAGLVNVLVTNGFVEEKPLRELLQYVDALNIDLKSIRESFYKKLCKASLAPVLAACKVAKEKSHLEITNLIIPGENDSDEDLSELVEWVATNLGKETPLHFSRYFPHHKMSNPPTPEATLQKAYRMGKQSLYYCYLGNLYAKNGSDTHCPQCGNTLVERNDYSVRITGIEGRKCSRCGRPVDFVLK